MNYSGNILTKKRLNLEVREPLGLLAKTIIFLISVFLGLSISIFILILSGVNASDLWNEFISPTLEDYKKIGIIPDALRNYLLRLGWSYKDKEIFTKQESIDLFNLSGVGKSPSKLDMSRILSINETYIKTINEKSLFNFFKEYTTIYSLKKLNKLFSLIVFI